MRVCLLTPGLPAPEPVAEYARRLAERHDVLTALTERPPPADVAGTAAVAEALAAEPCDVAVAMDWRATAHLSAVPATRHVVWVDHFAHRRMGTWQADRFAAQLAYDLPVDFVAAAPWVRDTLAELRPEARCVLVTSGAPAPTEGAPAAPPSTAPLRVHPSGDEARAAVGAMSEAHAEASLGEADVVVMLSSVDGVLDAPLRGFLAGATAVVGPAHDAGDLVRHGENGFVADADDPRGAARFLDLLARDRDLLARLREAAGATGAAWPTAEQAAAEMEAALQRLVAEDPPPAAAWPVRLMGDAIGGAAVFRQEIATLTAEVHRLQAPPPPLARRALAALKRRAKARLSG